MRELSLKFWNTLNLEQKDQYSLLLEHYKNRAFNKAKNRTDKASIKNTVNGAIDSFCDAHPNGFNKELKGSLLKRVAGTLDAYFKNNKPLKKCL